MAPILITLGEHTCENRCPPGLACCSSLGWKIWEWSSSPPTLPSPSYTYNFPGPQYGKPATHCIAIKAVNWWRWRWRTWGEQEPLASDIHPSAIFLYLPGNLLIYCIVQCKIIQRLIWSCMILNQEMFLPLLWDNSDKHQVLTFFKWTSSVYKLISYLRTDPCCLFHVENHYGGPTNSTVTLSPLWWH